MLGTSRTRQSPSPLSDKSHQLCHSPIHHSISISLRSISSLFQCHFKVPFHQLRAAFLFPAHFKTFNADSISGVCCQHQKPKETYIYCSMESLQESVTHCFFGDQLDVGCFEQGFVNSELLSFEEEEEEETQSMILSLENKMPFLQMLQSVESPQLFDFKPPNFQTLLRLQHLNNNNDPFMETQIQAMELESCVTREALDLHSPVKSETNNDLRKNPGCSASCFEVADNGSKNVSKSPLVARERSKRKRTKPAKSKNKEEVESQRMTHIAVERNRRRQMNDYLNSLRSLMPPSYIQRGDQASIIGGAIDFVKELEQLVQSMETQKRMRRTEENNSSSSTNSESKSAIEISQGESKTGGVEIEINVIHNHVNLKIQCERRPGQLVQGIVTLESLRLTVLHLNITSSQTSVLYSFNLKMEEDCKLRSADEISATVHRIFN